MNLIEQLGGYEKAKLCLDTPTARECVKNELSSALLEYRRANNIFEVGDLVTHPTYDWKILKVHDPIPSEGILFAKTNDHVKHHWGHGLVFDDIGVVCVSYNECRHVTNDEIKAGKRLWPVKKLKK